MTRRRDFAQVDVFASGGHHGNPVAVVLDSEGVSTEEMLEFTEWTNLSETTFVSPPTDPAADYRVRIFCPGRELDFAGHPTLGTCAAWLAAGGEPGDAERIVQECGAGLVPIRRTHRRLAFAAPPMTRFGPVEPELLARRLDQLGLAQDDVVASSWIDNGPGWMGLLLGTAAAVLDVSVPTESIRNFDVGVIGLYDEGAETAAEVRGLFADAHGRVREDPVTGSLNASAAQWLLGLGRLDAPYVASQGTAMGRRGRIHVDAFDGDVWVGGDTTVTVTGTIQI